MHALPPAAASRRCSSRGRLMAAASLVEHRLQARELQPLQRAGAGAVAQGLVALRHAGSSQIRDRNHAACAGKWIPNRWTTRNAPGEHTSLGSSVALLICTCPLSLSRPCRVMSQALRSISCLSVREMRVSRPPLQPDWTNRLKLWTMGHGHLSTLCLGQHSRSIRLWPVLPWISWLYIFPIYSFVLCVPTWEYKASWGEEFGLCCSLQYFWTRLYIRMCGGEGTGGRKSWREINDK